MEAKAWTGGVERHRALVADFLAQRAIAVVGVTRSRESPANAIYSKLQNAGYTVYPVNPNADEFRGNRCFRSVRELEGPVNGVVLVTRPDVTESVVDECIESGIPRIWIHDMLGTHPRLCKRISSTSTSRSAAAVGRAHAAGIAVIAGGCPMQHIEPVDPFHRCLFWASGKFGNYAEERSEAGM